MVWMLIDNILDSQQRVLTRGWFTSEVLYLLCDLLLFIDPHQTFDTHQTSEPRNKHAEYITELYQQGNKLKHEPWEGDTIKKEQI